MTVKQSGNPAPPADNLALRSLVHDLNNLITVIQGNLTLAREALAEGESSQRNLVAAEKAMGQLRPLIGQLASLHQPLGAEQVTAAEPLARECLAICLGSSPVTGQLKVEADLPAVAMERSSLARIINNLLINAREAMPQGGRVVLRLSRLGDSELLPEELPRGDYVVFELTDNGPGIAPELLNRIFEPNYSEKVWGQGLGLASSRALAAASGGTLTAHSTLGQGATFRLILPSAGNPE